MQNYCTPTPRMSCKNKMHGFIWVIIFLSVQLPVAVGPEPYTAAEYRVDGNDFRDELICHYFDAGYQIKEIVALLAVCHNVYISIRHVKTLLRHFSRRRRGDESLAVDILEVFLYELHSGGGDCLGYRSMTRRLRTTHNLNVQRSTVRLLQQVLDPIGVENRRAHRSRRRHYTARGPNFIIHIDGYDKLKPYGFAIHGAIDGFSRKVLWLTVGPSNNNPRIICNLYLNFVRRLNGVPFIVRADRGTENTLVANVQAALRWYHNDAFSKEISFMFGRSTSNQRIECWWSQLRRMCTSVWINFFKDMRDEGIFDNSDHIQVEVMRFCFSHLLQEDLDKSARDWNQHRIRRQRNVECPAGIPDIMYFAPEVYDAVDYKMPLNFTEEEILEVREEYCSDYPQYGCARWFRRSLEDMLGNLDNYQMPSDMHEARRLFVALKDMMLRE